MFTIHLHNCLFFAYHGLYKEEAIVGASFEVNLSASFEQQEKITSIKQTINYVNIYEMVKKRFEQPTQLLETLAQQIINDIHLSDSRITTIDIKIKKLNPPITDFTGSVGVSCSQSF